MIARRQFTIVTVLVAAALLPAALTARADAPAPIYDRVNLQASVVREVANDEMRVVLAVEKTGTDPAELADTINRDMAWAIETLKDKANREMVTWQTRAYQTHPNYVQGRINGWVSNQELLLRSRDSAQLTSLLADLQSRMLVRSMQFSVSKAVRDQVEDELVGEAMAAFKRRAELVRKHMEDRRYRIVEIHLNTEFGGGYRRAAHAMPMARAAASEIAAPAVETGESEIRVSVNGSIEFQLP